MTSIDHTSLEKYTLDCICFCVHICLCLQFRVKACELKLLSGSISLVIREPCCLIAYKVLMNGTRGIFAVMLMGACMCTGVWGKRLQLLLSVSKFFNVMHWPVVFPLHECYNDLVFTLMSSGSTCVDFSCKCTANNQLCYNPVGTSWNSSISLMTCVWLVKWNSLVRGGDIF